MRQILKSIHAWDNLYRKVVFHKEKASFFRDFNPEPIDVARTPLMFLHVSSPWSTARQAIQQPTPSLKIY